MQEKSRRRRSPAALIAGRGQIRTQGRRGAFDCLSARPTAPPELFLLPPARGRKTRIRQGLAPAQRELVQVLPRVFRPTGTDTCAEISGAEA